MKKIISLLLVLAMMLALVACGGSQAPVATEAPATEAPATEAPATEAPTEAPTEEMKEPEWIHETQAPEEQQPEKKGMSGLWFGMFLITGTLSLVLIGALVFRRKSY